ncbi:aldose epimerase family protein [uncultured Tyzzerella sp.]|uniref:aldose epimerase family protein n=1 Tax=uncultured Tyzzerella sp. TaxID=2321398 RepID=UPI002942463A|nr:aldose epimerase family protein [uncultured Tyzzerella sp.]
MSILVENFLEEPYKIITLKNNNITIKLTNIGASIVSAILKDKNGNDVDVILGFDNPKGYLNNEFCLGATIGRNANRIENATFKIDNKTYNLDKNDGENNLHSGFNSTSSIVWDYKTDNINNTVIFSTLLADGFQNMEGNFSISVFYTLKEDNSLVITYKGKCDKKTIANFTNHTYFNLNGHTDPNILNQEIMINADSFTPFKENTNIPSGKILNVFDTPMDFTKFKAIGKDIEEDYSQIKLGNGYDHNYVINNKNNDITLAAKAYSKKTGICLEAYTDLPGLQFYTGNFNNIKQFGKCNTNYLSRSGFCFETQYFPNCYNIETFKKPIIDANQLYQTTTIYKLSITRL